MNTLRVAMLLSIGPLLSACSEGDLPPPIAAAGTAVTEAGSGGMSAGSGGTGAQGGSGGSGGAGGVGGGSGAFMPDAVSVTLDFADDLEGFLVNYACPTSALDCAAVTAPTAPPPASGDAGAPAPVQSTALFDLAHDPSVGEPDEGSARLDIRFNAAGQLVNFALNVTSAIDMTTKQLRAKVQLGAGGSATTGKMYVKTGMDYVYSDSGQVTLTAGAWVDLSYPSATGTFTPVSAAYNAADVRELGIEFATTGMSPAPVVIHVDTVQY